ncbi:hypothetical protein [Candidatus Phytoplasma melaleucae]|uniref:Uncharacterized protein n=1 Tax=Candidatus Phytoplasma melaleucae TaxID=2982630 RepID=A0ABT9DCR0_9MOLU|nr:hypothetical protein ['Melaleuca sp.' phytoplasma]MDO8167908.1 hypothetical protein ['Melaleuca sp.' phytoplasma]MDV3205184.1 hypothetical protein [Weeping tea tree witches'-broom phytoplasma]
MLRKITVISWLLTISLVIEFFFVKFLSIDCHTSLLKLELLPIILIGFLFGFKFSFFANFFYILIHISLEFLIDYHKMSFFLNVKSDQSFFLQILLLLFMFVIPYIFCSLSGLFYQENLKNLTDYKSLILSLSLITIMQICSYACFTYCLSLLSHNPMLDDFRNILWVPWFSSSIYMIIFLYYLLSVIINNLLIGFILFFINPILKDNIETLFLN